MSESSFPYMHIAKEFDVPYGTVVLYADALRYYGGNYWRAWAVDELTRLLPDDKHWKHFGAAMQEAEDRRMNVTIKT